MNNVIHCVDSVDTNYYIIILLLFCFNILYPTNYCSKWGLQNIIDDESMTKKDAMKRFRKCCEPGAGPITPLPAKGAEREEFDSYNEEALELFHEHATRCLWCRTTNKAAMDALRKAEEDARRRAEEEEEARRRREEEEARRRAAEVLQNT